MRGPWWNDGWLRIRSSPAAWRRRASTRATAGRKLLDGLARVEPAAFFIVVGANDGGHDDPLRPVLRSRRTRRWHGLMVEPQDDAYARLSARYGGDDRIALQHAAIADHDGRMPFYELSPPADRERREIVGPYDLLGSLSREVLTDHVFVENASERVTVSEVDCMRFESLCRKHSVDRLDLLAIDTEGYDLEVIRGVDLDRWRPRLVVFEHALLARADRAEARGRLEAAGYSVIEEFMDTWCLDTRVADALTELWHRLEPTEAAVVLHPGG